MCVCVKYQMCKSQVYSSIYYTLFQYDIGKWFKIKILQYNQIPIFNSSIFQNFPVFLVSVATLFKFLFLRKYDSLLRDTDFVW